MDSARHLPYHRRTSVFVEAQLIRSALRALSAGAAVVAFLGGVANLVVHGGSPWHALPIALAGLLAAAAMFGGAPPRPADLPRLDEQLRRFRTAMLACFAAAWALYAGAVTAHAYVQSLASLGVAFWLVAFVLMFFVVHYRAQRRLAAAEPRDRIRAS